MTEQPKEVHPTIVAWAARISELSAALPDLTSIDMDARRGAERQLSDALAQEFTSPVPPGVRILGETVSTRLGPLRVRRYLPTGLTSPVPTEVFLHGGGFVSGSIDELINDRLLAARARDARIQVISLEYRLAPEHPYPAAVDDVIALVDALREDDGALDVDTARIGLAGASAGAGIAAGASLHLRDRGDGFLIHQSLQVPAVALDAFGTSSSTYGRGYGLDGYETLADLYLGPAGRAAEYGQPLFAHDVGGLPPAHIQVAEIDPLRDGGLAYAERLREAGVRVVIDVGYGHVHGSPGLTAVFPPARAWQKRSSAAARRAYHPANDDAH